MKCWCEEVYNYKCVECEGKGLFRNLSPMDRDMVKFFLKNHDKLALRKMIDAFEARHKRDWTDFTYADLIKANANQNQTSSQA